MFKQQSFRRIEKKRKDNSRISFLREKLNESNITRALLLILIVGLLSYAGMKIYSLTQVSKLTKIAQTATNDYLRNGTCSKKTYFTVTFPGSNYPTRMLTCEHNGVEITHSIR